MELQEQGEEKQFVQVQFGKVEAAICCLSSGPKMKNPSSTEQFNQFKVNRDTHMKGHGNDDGRQGEGSNTVCLKQIIVCMSIYFSSCLGFYICFLFGLL